MFATNVTYCDQATRTARIATQQRLLAKVQQHANVLHARNAAQQQQYKLALQQLQAQYNIAPKHQVSSVQTQRAPHGTGVCAQVHAIAAQCGGNRKATLAACAVAGINAATAATQFAKYKNLQK
jgi:hypothetical protein